MEDARGGSRGRTRKPSTGSSESSDRRTEVVVVGAGPAGCVLSYLLARSGVETVLVERQTDLSREFRGYGFQPLVSHLFDQMGLLGDVLELDHREVYEGRLSVFGETYTMLDLRTPPTPTYPILLLEQPPLLRLLIERASNYETFSFLDGTTVRDVARDRGVIRGVEASHRESGEQFRLRARLVVGADGRYSTTRNAVGVDAGMMDSTVELLWFKLRSASADTSRLIRIEEDGVLIYAPLDESTLQGGLLLEKGTYSDLRERGIDALRSRLTSIDPSLREGIETGLTDFSQCSLLHIEPGISDRWTDDGLVLIGDAAHVASPFAGQGNSLALQDAVVLHPIVTGALGQTSGTLPNDRLRAFEDIRRPAVEEVVRAQRAAERAISFLVTRPDWIPVPILKRVVRCGFAAVRFPPVMKRVQRTLAFGPQPVRVADSYFTDR